MASSSNGNVAPTIKPQFIRILISPSFHFQRLKLPPKFIKEEGNTLGEHAFLRAPEGREHKVKLSTDENGDVWFTTGWEEFVDTYSLSYGSLLSFRYDGMSHFHVTIFATSGTEIEYPISNTESSDEDDDEDEDEDEDEDGNQGAIGAEGRARDFECVNPCFVAPMRKAYLDGDYRLWIPAKHAERYLKGRSSTIFLKAGARGGKLWKVSVSYEAPQPGRLNTARLTRGWKSFTVSNDLRIGDACVFELIDDKLKTYMVHIFREERH